jgi:hypothetical protein
VTLAMRDRGLQALLDVAPVVLICLTLTLGSILAFPEMDDGYLMLSLREIGTGDIVRAHADRPLVAHIWTGIARLFGEYFWQVGFVLHALLWTTLGLQAGVLWRYLFPEARKYGVVVSCLAVAPIVVQCQLSTVTITLIGVLSSVLAYAALLLLLRFMETTDGSRLALVFSLFLFVLGILVSEYAVPVAAMTVVLVVSKAMEQSNRVTRWTPLRLTILTACATGATYVVYAASAHGRSEVDPRQVLGFGAVYRYPFGLITRAWRVIIGAYGDAISGIYASWENKSSILALICGLLISIIIVVRCLQQSAVYAPRRRSFVVLSAALITGLTPIVLLRPSSSLAPFASRFYVPVIPLASSLTLCVALSLVRKRFRIGIVALLGFLIGFMVFSNSWSAYRRQRFMSSLGSYLKQEVGFGGGGYTVAVISNKENCQVDYECTAKLTSNWPVEIENKFWAYTKEEALESLGTRAERRSIRNIDVNVRSVRREGPIEKLLWVEIDGDSFVVEPYSLCQQNPGLEQITKLTKN